MRRAASANLAKLASAMFEAGEQPALKSELLPLFSALSTDEQVRVRVSVGVRVRVRVRLGLG